MPVMEIFDLFRVMSKDKRAFYTMKPALKKMTGTNNKGDEKMYDYFSRMIDEGVEKGEKAVTTLFSKLYSLGRDDDVKKATTDHEYLKKLMDEYGVTPAIHA